MSTSSVRAAELAVIGEVYTSTTLWPSIQTLCDEFNGRFVGSDNERNAAAYIAEQLRSYGLSNVHTESFDIHGWERGEASLIANNHPLQCIGLPGTPPCELTAPLINLGAGEPVDFAKAGKTAKGKIALVRSVGSHRLEKYARSVKAGCVGFVFAGPDLGSLPHTGSIDFGGAAPLPGVGIAQETYLRLERMLALGAVSVALNVQARLFPTQGLNVIGDIVPAGADSLSGDYLLLCAHYDGHDIAQGAVDNATGTVAVMEAARALMQVRDQLNIGIRVALWSGEEVGMIGSGAYAVQHKAELKRLRLVFNCDIVSNPGPLWMGINGVDIERVTQFFRELADGAGTHSQVHALQITGNEMIVPYSDHFPFYMHGVPALMVATPHGQHPGMGPHTPADTLDKVNVHGLRTSTAFVARALLHLANDPAPLPAHQASKAEVQATLREAGYDVLLKAQGRWKF